MKTIIFTMKRAKKATFLYILLCSFLFIFLGLVDVYADAPEYNTDEYNINIVINKDNTFEYTEMIDVDFKTPSRGIYRNIPRSGRYSIKNIKVNGYDYKVFNKNRNKVIRIGSPDKFIEGKKQYTIKYTIKGYYQSKGDYLYLDVFPSGWETPIGKVNAHIKFPKDFPMNNLKIYSGKYGDKDLYYGDINIDNDNKTVDFYAENMPDNIGVTIGTDLPNNYWQDVNKKGGFTSLIILLSLIAIVALRLTAGRNPRITEVVEFNPPEDMTPLDIGYVIDGTVDKKDISSMIFYLANKGYITIKEVAENSFEFILRDYPKDEKNSVKLFFDGIFNDGASEGQEDIGKTVDPEKIGSGVADKLVNITGAVEAQFVGENKIFSKKSKTADIVSKTIFFIANILVYIVYKFYTGIDTDEPVSVFVEIFLGLLFASIITAGMFYFVRLYYRKYSGKKASTGLKLTLFSLPYILISFGMAYFTCVRESSIDSIKVFTVYMMFLIASPIFISGMRSRTSENARLMGRILGFKNFISTAEIAKLEELIEGDPDYFYNILPYAYIFGLTKKWANKFDNILDDKHPDWYESDKNVYVPGLMNTAYFATMMNSVSKDMIGTMNIKDTDGFGGFSGGGFSGGGGGFTGGGFGGGGGGAW